MELREAIELLRGLPGWAAALVVFGGSLIEYVFPPFPGDTVVVAGAVVGAVGHHSKVLLGMAVTAGAGLGSMFDWYVGRRLARTWDAAPRSERATRAVTWIRSRFARHGAPFLALNRFFPGVRAFFFVAAGLSGLRAGPVLFWALVAATLWNALLFVVGWFLGGRIDQLESIGTDGLRWAWIPAAVLVCWVAWRLYRVARGSSSER